MILWRRLTFDVRGGLPQDVPLTEGLGVTSLVRAVVQGEEVGVHHGQDVD